MKAEVRYNKEMAHVQQVAEKVTQLGLLYQSVLLQNRKLGEQVQSLRTQLSEKNNELHELKTRYNTIQFTRNIELTSKDIPETKRVVNRMLRDIDQCIALIKR